MGALEKLTRQIANCRICRDKPVGKALGHGPRPVLYASNNAKIMICGQAPGIRVHRSGVPFSDPSGERLRGWLGVDEEQFYDRNKFAIVPMGFCFPGLDAKGGDLPPRKECAAMWRDQLMGLMGQVELMLVVGLYAQAWHLGKYRKETLTQTVRAWREYYETDRMPRLLPLPHPSWRNNAWIRKNEWFDKELVVALQKMIQVLI